ncbi:uncharacterized protein KY384_000813 [Bacidia gigantensis]|uniref:uncharacterized protein n=1 Tax=Bacidia gigantensis TaxID=2732470 RepID=UPI001D046A8D|nr:uncharacterized protein KY384_000813 [Bacidia gigantensis]KAG8526051.1 hypothetical protein KY384_000813 [Bacidia gigantensis]
MAQPTNPDLQLHAPEHKKKECDNARKARDNASDVLIAFDQGQRSYLPRPALIKNVQDAAEHVKQVDEEWDTAKQRRDDPNIRAPGAYWPQFE